MRNDVMNFIKEHSSYGDMKRSPKKAKSRNTIANLKAKKEKSNIKEGAKITNFFHNSNNTVTDKSTSGDTHVFDNKDKLIHNLKQQIEELTKKNEKAKDQLEFIQNQKAKINKRYYEAIAEKDAFGERSRYHLCKIVLQLERRILKENYNELTQKKIRVGFPRYDPVKKSTEWINGSSFYELEAEKKIIEKEWAALQARKKELKNNKKLNTSVIKEIDFELIKIKQKYTEIDSELLELRRETTDIYYQEKLYIDNRNCYFSKNNDNTGIKAWPLLDEKYQILSLLGKGGFAEVFKAYDLFGFKYVACKVNLLRPKMDHELRKRYWDKFTAENEIYKKLDHPNIVKYIATIMIDDNSVATILEYCEGKDLDYLLKVKKTLPEKEAKEIIQQLLSAVKYLNQCDPVVIHYDIKPQNILFTKYGKIKMTDFGLCKLHEVEESKMELTTVGAGTYWYLPPECFDDARQTPRISSKVDIWSIGVVYYQMLYGKKPFGNNMSQEEIRKKQVLLKDNKVAFPKDINVSKQTKHFIAKCLTPDQNKRIDIFSAFKLFHE